MSSEVMEKRIDEAEAPLGFIPVAKSSVDNSQNICRSCDWRSVCDGSISCMAHKRKDGMSVVFKWKAPAEFGKYGNFQSKFEACYARYGIRLGLPISEYIREDIRFIPLAVDKGFSISEGEIFDRENRFEKVVEINQQQYRVRVGVAVSSRGWARSVAWFDAEDKCWKAGPIKVYVDLVDALCDDEIVH